MSSLKKLIGLLLTLNLLWNAGLYFKNKFSCKKAEIKIETRAIDFNEKEIIYINGVRCYRPKANP